MRVCTGNTFFIIKIRLQGIISVYEFPLKVIGRYTIISGHHLLLYWGKRDQDLPCRGTSPSILLKCSLETKLLLTLSLNWSRYFSRGDSTSSEDLIVCVAQESLAEHGCIILTGRRFADFPSRLRKDQGRTPGQDNTLFAMELLSAFLLPGSRLPSWMSNVMDIIFTSSVGQTCENTLSVSVVKENHFFSSDDSCRKLYNLSNARFLELRINDFRKWLPSVLVPSSSLPLFVSIITESKNEHFTWLLKSCNPIKV